VPTTEQYAASIVDQYHIVADMSSPSHRAADDVIPLLKRWGKQHLLGLTLSGAYAKNTAISLCPQVDVLVSLTPVPDMEIKKVFWNLFVFLTDQGMSPRTRYVSVEVRRGSLRVDLILAYREGNAGHLLFNKKTGMAVRTNVNDHIHLVANSGRQQEICALKIWRERNDLIFPSFFLELVVLRALHGERFGQLAENVTTVLRFIGNQLEQAVVRDPANAENIVSNDLTDSEKKSLAKAARSAIYDENWKRILW
jgi:hypothetical protein